MLASTAHNHDHYLENGEHVISREVTLSSIGEWLTKGWNDMARAPAASLFFGAIMMLSVMAVAYSYASEPVAIFKLATFFIMLSPFLATGLYYVAMKLENGQKPTVANAMMAWKSNSTNIALYALTLGIVIAIWGRIVPLIAAVVKSNNLLIVDPDAGLNGFLFSQVGMEFLTLFLIASALVALFVFSISVITMPMMLKDKKVGVVSAMILSFQVFRENRKVMLAWAATIGVLLTIGLLSLGFGMLVIMPLLAYASWHAFNDLVVFDDEYPAINPS
jgi:uncharacterized membrane protein